MSFTVAIVGRPNVGKSTFFNRLVGKRLAIVHDLPGVTRDRREGTAKIGDLEFNIIDTAGLEEAEEDSLPDRMREQTELALQSADVALLLVDAREGVTPMDQHFAEWLRKQHLPIILIANKCESKKGEEGRYECYALGLGDPIPFSAEHGDGMNLLYDVLTPFAEEAANKDDDINDDIHPLTPLDLSRFQHNLNTFYKLQEKEKVFTKEEILRMKEDMLTSTSSNTELKPIDKTMSKIILRNLKSLKKISKIKNL